MTSELGGEIAPSSDVAAKNISTRRIAAHGVLMAAESPDDILLLGIDLQPTFVEAIPDGSTVLDACAFAVAAATGLGLPVAFTEQVPDKLGPTAASLRALAPQAPVWAKTTFSALTDSAIASALRQHDAGHLLLAGVETSICVYQTAVDALASGFAVTVLSDCVGARRATDATCCLDALARHGAHVLPAETVFYALLRDARHPFFRAFTRLVKARAATSSPHA